MTACFAFHSGKAVVQIATIEIAIIISLDLPRATETFYFLNTLKSLSRTGFSIFARASNSPASSHIPLQAGHSSIFMPLKSISIRSIPHFGHFIKCSSLSFSLSSFDACFFFRSSICFFISCSIRTKYSSSCSVGFTGIETPHLRIRSPFLREGEKVQSMYSSR